MKILGTGLTGLVGSRIVELLPEFEFDLSRENITDKDLIKDRIEKSDADVVLHLAAKTDVDGCEKDKNLGEKGDAWRINVIGTENVALSCSESNKKMVYISTDFVFDGEKEGSYIEDDLPNPVNWYGKTKFEGEKRIQDIYSNYLIVRIAYPYRKSFAKKDFMRGLINRFQRGESLNMVTDHIMVPTFIDDIAFALKDLIEKNQTGIFHMVGSQPVTPYDTAILIADIFGFDKSKIKKTTREEFFKGRAKRGYNLCLKNDKIEKLGIKMKTLDQGIREIKG